MTALLVMSSEVDLALERILSDRLINNAVSPSTISSLRHAADPEDSDEVTTTSEEGSLPLTTVFTKSIVAVQSSPIDMDYTDSKETQHASLAVASGGGGNSSDPPNRPDDGEEYKRRLNESSKSVFDYLIDDAILGSVFEAHRAAKTAQYFAFESLETDADEDAADDEYRMVPADDQRYVDVFGQALVATSKTSKALSQLECVCPQCHQPRLACRFAPHLEKCMGMGRNSSRLASRRLAAAAAASSSNSNATSSNSGGGGGGGSRRGAAPSAHHHDNASSNGGGDSSGDDGDGDDQSYVQDDDDDDDDWTLSVFGKKRSQQRKRGGVGGGGGSSTRTPPKKRATGQQQVRVSPPKKPVGLRSHGASELGGGDLLLANETSSGGGGGKKMRKNNSYSKFTEAASTSSTPQPPSSSQQGQFDFGLESNDFLSLADNTFDPPSPSF